MDDSGLIITTLTMTRSGHFITLYLGHCDRKNFSIIKISKIEKNQITKKKKKRQVRTSFLAYGGKEFKQVLPPPFSYIKE